MTLASKYIVEFKLIISFRNKYSNVLMDFESGHEINKLRQQQMFATAN